MKTPHQPTLDEIAAAYVTMRSLGRSLGVKAWDKQLADHKGLGAPHPQQLRRENVGKWKEAQERFTSLMEQLVAHRVGLEAGKCPE